MIKMITLTKTTAFVCSLSEEPEIIKPKSREMDIGGGFGDTGIPTSDDKWDELSDDSESDDETKDVTEKSEKSEKPTSGS